VWRHLSERGLAVEGPFERQGYTSLTLRDPDGVIIELAAASSGREPDSLSTWPEPVPTLAPELSLCDGLHHITAVSSDIERTHAFVGDLLGLRRVSVTRNPGDPGATHWYRSPHSAASGTLLGYIERDPMKCPHMRVGAGQAHHVTLAVADETSLLEWRERLIAAGLRVSPVMDRIYFRSIYITGPDCQIIELATLGPGFTADEPAEQLGLSLKLPPWLERNRCDIQAVLRPLKLCDSATPAGGSQ
jgi:glyoxalase family protein